MRGATTTLRALVQLAVLGAVALCASPVSGQGAPGTARIGMLTPTTNAAREDVFRRELARLGHVEGRNLVIEYRTANGDFDRLPALANELVRANVDLIVAVVTQAGVAAKSATKTIPIVIVGVGDPVGAGLVASFARPGGNVTGNSGAAVEVVGKQLELFREFMPNISRVTALHNPSNRVFQAQQLEQTKRAARGLGIELAVVEASRPDALDAAFRAVESSRAEGLLILADPMFGLHADRIARLALARRLPTVSGFETYADAGVLVAYGANFDEFYRRGAVYVDRILRGAKPADLPVERPNRFELVVNLRSAKALGITLPAALVARADRVVQ
jgi:putative tryptophan/tyrosine transport system substrate-binding protein